METAISFRPISIRIFEKQLWNRKSLSLFLFGVFVICKKQEAHTTPAFRRNHWNRSNYEHDKSSTYASVSLWTTIKYHYALTIGKGYFTSIIMPWIVKNLRPPYVCVCLLRLFCPFSSFSLCLSFYLDISMCLWYIWIFCSLVVGIFFSCVSSPSSFWKNSYLMRLFSMACNLIT